MKAMFESNVRSDVGFLLKLVSAAHWMHTCMCMVGVGMHVCCGGDVGVFVCWLCACIRLKLQHAVTSRAVWPC